VVAALGASALTILGSFLVDRSRSQAAAKAAAGEARRLAYMSLLQASVGVVMLTQRFDTIRRFHSGPSAAVNMAVRYWRPLDPLEVFDSAALHVRPMLESQLQVWSRGSQAGIEAGDRVVSAATECLDVLNVAGRRVLLDRLGLKRWSPTELQKEQLKAAMRSLTAAQTDLLHVIRNETGELHVTLPPEFVGRPLS
jgi:hypothetical protein